MVPCVACNGTGEQENYDVRDPDLRTVTCCECLGEKRIWGGRATELQARWAREDRRVEKLKDHQCVQRKEQT